MSDASGNYMNVIEALQARIEKLEAALQRIIERDGYTRAYEIDKDRIEKLEVELERVREQRKALEESGDG